MLFLKKTSQLKSSVGGCRLTTISASRICKNLSRFSSNKSIVTRPISVFGMIRLLSSDHSKCSFQICARGLKIATVLFASLSKTSLLSDFRRLQWKHASARFSSESSWFGVTWSIVKRTYCQRSLVWQYSQRKSARWRTISRVSSEILRDPIEFLWLIFGKIAR